MAYNFTAILRPLAKRLKRLKHLGPVGPIENIGRRVAPDAPGGGFVREWHKAREARATSARKEERIREQPRFFPSRAKKAVKVRLGERRHERPAAVALALRRNPERRERRKRNSPQAQVALEGAADFNGTKRLVHDEDVRIGRELRVDCFRGASNNPRKISLAFG